MMKSSVGIIGGTGFYDFFEGKTENLKVKTEFGNPSDSITVGKVGNKKVAFLPRHGAKHQLPPHKVPYRANIAAFQKIGVNRIIAPCAVGSLKSEIAPGDFVFCDQFVDRTKARKDTFFDGPRVAHIAMDKPYCPEMRKIAISQAKKSKVNFHTNGTVVIIEGPRFSTLAESLWFSGMGWDVVNMTQYPELVLASELGICYLNISLVTDYDVGIYSREKMEPVSIEQILDTFQKNTRKLKILISRIIQNLPEKKSCGCRERAEKAFL